MNKYSLTLIRKALFKSDSPIPGEFQFSEDDLDVVKHNWEELNKKVIVDYRLLATLKNFKTSRNFDAHPTVDEPDKVRQKLNEMSLLPNEKSEAEDLIQIIGKVKIVCACMIFYILYIYTWILFECIHLRGQIFTNLQ